MINSLKTEAYKSKDADLLKNLHGSLKSKLLTDPPSMQHLLSEEKKGQPDYKKKGIVDSVKWT